MNELVDLARGVLAAEKLEERWKASDEFFTRIAEMLRWFIVPRCRASPGAVDEILGNTIDSIVTNLHKCNLASDTSLQSWCKTIAQRRIADYFRKGSLPLAQYTEEELKSLFEKTSDPRGIDPSQAASHNEAVAMLGRLGQPCHELLLAHFIEGVEITEWAKRAGVAYDTARIQLGRCLTKARRLMA